MAVTLSWSDMTKNLMPSGRNWLPGNTLSLRCAQLWQKQNQVLRQICYVMSFVGHRLMSLSNMQRALHCSSTFFLPAVPLIKQLLSVAAACHKLTAALQIKGA